MSSKIQPNDVFALKKDFNVGGYNYMLPYTYVK